MTNPWAIAGSAAAPIFGGAYGEHRAADDRRREEDRMQQAAAAYGDIDIPEMQRVALERLQRGEQLTPMEEQALAQGDTQLAGIEVDPQFRAAQMAALSRLQEQAGGGLTLADEVAMSESEAASDAAARGRQGAITSQMARRGMSGSGLEAVQRSMAEQGGINAAARARASVLASAMQRGNLANQQAAALAGRMGDTDYSRSSQAAQAQDAINRFNTAQAQGVGQRNVLAGNQAREFNVTRGHNVADKNVGFSQQEAWQPNEFAQQAFKNRITRASGIADTQADLSGMFGGRADAEKAKWGEIGQGAGEVGTAFMPK